MASYEEIIGALNSASEKMDIVKMLDAKDKAAEAGDLILATNLALEEASNFLVSIQGVRTSELAGGVRSTMESLTEVTGDLFEALEGIDTAMRQIGYLREQVNNVRDITRQTFEGGGL